MNTRQFSISSFVLILIIDGLTTAVNTNDFPRILTQTYNQTLNLSDLAILTCHVTNLGNHHVTWLKYDRNTSTFLPLTVGKQVFLSDKRYSISYYSISTDNSYWNLEIYNLQLSDEGIYECKISNRRQSVSIKIYLYVQIPMIIQPSRLYVEPGSNVELDCMIYNINTSSITWHFSSYNYKYDYHHHQYDYDIYEKYQHEKNISKSQLIIRHAQPYHSGLWTCTYKRQKRSARIFVEKGAMKRLLSNNHASSNVQCTMSLILFALLLGHHMTHRI
ncbi:unnamed protein product [Rotaria sp. Silwood2]|nr:unnamed protein product [Rotaria sp. Silwood2]